MKVELGTWATDVVSQLEGIAIAHCEHITGERQTLLQPVNSLSSVSKPEPHWIDDGRLKPLVYRKGHNLFKPITLPKDGKHGA